MLSVLSCLNFRSGWTGAAHPSGTQFFRAALAENCFPRPPLDLPICCQFFPDLISARGGRAPRIQAQIVFPICACGKLFSKTSLPASYMLSVPSCLNFRSGWTGAAHPSATQCFRAAPAEICCAIPPLDLSICCQFCPVLISARSGRAPRTTAQLNFSAPHLREIAFQDLPWISLYVVSSLLS